jgi:type I restriction enzyme S subunit
MYGGWEQIGRTGILGVQAATNQALSALVPLRAGLSPQYVLLALQHGRNRWKPLAASTRKDPNISKADIERFLLPKPADTEEQDKIAQVHARMQQRIRAEQATLRKLVLLKHGLMHDLLTGRVRLPLPETRVTPAGSAGGDSG